MDFLMSDLRVFVFLIFRFSLFSHSNEIKADYQFLLRISYGENNHKIKRSEPLKNCAV